MRMLFAREYLELSQHLASEPVLREHSLDCVLNDEIRSALLHLSHAEILLAPNVAAIEHVLLLLFFLAGEYDLVRVDNDNEIPGVHVRRISRLVPTTKQVCDFHGQTTQDLILGVDDDPVAFHGFLLGEICFHRISRKRGELLPSGESMSMILRVFLLGFQPRIPELQTLESDTNRSRPMKVGFRCRRPRIAV